MAEYKLDPTDLALIRSPSQRFTLRVAFTPAYTPTVTDWVRADHPGGREDIDWTPDADLGPNKVGVVGQPVEYLVQAVTRAGVPFPAEDQSVDWDDGTVDTPASGVVQHTYTEPGLFEIKIAITDSATDLTFVSHRWVRIFASWADAYDGIAEVSGPSGSISSGGHSVSLKVTGLTGDYQTGDFPDRLGVILYVDQQWGVDDARGLGTTRTPGHSAAEYEHDPNYLFQGYVVGNSVRVDAEQHSVTFQAQTAEYFLKIMQMQEMRFLAAATPGYGQVADNLTFSGAINHLVYQHTNWAVWHTFFCWRECFPNVNLQPSITFNEGSVWQSISDCAANEFGRLYALRYGAVRLFPNINVRGLTWWGLSDDPPEMPFDATNCMSIEMSELPADRVGFVQLEAANPFNGDTLLAKYPAVPGDVGDRDVRKDLKCYDQDNLDTFAANLYWWGNARYGVTLKTAMTKVLDLGQIVVVDYADPQTRIDLSASVGGSGYRKPFYVERVSYDIDPGAGTWQANFTLAEIVNIRWNLSSQGWESWTGDEWLSVGGS